MSYDINNMTASHTARSIINLLPRPTQYIQVRDKDVMSDQGIMLSAGRAREVRVKISTWVRSAVNVSHLLE
jgi:hypothetical protein